ncbi:MAG: type II toxin-antitoxin system prevent-host-death family antitoxin [Pseudomonadota bacterium]
MRTTEATRVKEGLAMSPRQRYAQEVSVADFRKELGDFLSRAHYGNEWILIEKREKPFAGIVSVTDLEQLHELEEVAEQFGMTVKELLETLRAAREDDEKAKIFKGQCEKRSNVAA